MIFKSGERFTELGLMFKEAENATDIPKRISARAQFLKIAEIEEEAFNHLGAGI